MSLETFFEQFKDTCVPTEGVDFQWSAKGIGFGGMYFYLDKKDGYVHCSNESMSRQFLKDMLCKMVDNCVLDEPNERHADTGPGGKPPGYTPVAIEEKDND